MPPVSALSVSADSRAKRREEDAGSSECGGKEAGRGGGVALNAAEHRGAVVGGCIAYSTLLQPAIHILILHTLILPATNLDTFICVHFNGKPGSGSGLILYRW